MQGSQPRPPSQHPSLPMNPFLRNAVAGPSSQPHQPSMQMPPYPAYPQMAPQFMGAPYGSPMPMGYGMPQAYPGMMPMQGSGGYPGYAPMPHVNPAFALRQSLFQAPAYQVPTQNSGGYSYSASYIEQQAASAAQAQQAEPSAARPGRGGKQKRGGGSQPQPPRKSKPPPQQTSSIARGGPWRNCCLPDCNFVGAEKDVEIHEGDRHLIFKGGVAPVERSEEEEAVLRRGGPPPPIPGTSITLQTEEDIAKWVAQRKANWPSAKRIAEKEKERDDRIARGELPPPTRGTGRERGRGRGAERGARGRGGRGGRVEPYSQEGRDGAGRGRGRGRGGGVGGYTPGNGWEGVGEAATGVGGGVGDADSGSSDSDSSGSDSDSDSSSSAEPSTIPAKSSKSAPAGVPLPATMSADRQAMIQTQPPVDPAQEARSNVCKYWAKNGTCRNGDVCRFLHEGPGKAVKPPQPAQPGNRGVELPVDFGRSSLLGAMLQTSIAQTLSHLSQTINFLVDNDFLEGVELEVGQAETVREIRERLVEVGGGDVLGGVVDDDVEEGDEEEEGDEDVRGNDGETGDLEIDKEAPEGKGAGEDGVDERISEQT